VESRFVCKALDYASLHQGYKEMTLI